MLLFNVHAHACMCVSCRYAQRIAEIPLFLLLFFLVLFLPSSYWTVWCLLLKPQSDPKFPSSRSKFRCHNNFACVSYSLSLVRPRFFIPCALLDFFLCCFHTCDVIYIALLFHLHACMQTSWALTPILLDSLFSAIFFISSWF